jgi:2-polyprenyl-6-methoxyphenol hydroxylase-like FAD-dependent oxidoreductase
MNVTVIGAGIGGLTTALSLHAAGIDVRVYESVAEMRPSASASIYSPMRRANSSNSVSARPWPKL